jgi:hypothetical protein
MTHLNFKIFNKPTYLITNNGSGRFCIERRSVGNISEALGLAVVFGSAAGLLNWTYNDDNNDVTDVALQQLPTEGFIESLASIDMTNRGQYDQFEQVLLVVCDYAAKNDLSVLYVYHYLIIPSLIVAMTSFDFKPDQFNNVFTRKFADLSKKTQPDRNLLKQEFGTKAIIRGGGGTLSKTFFKNASKFLSLNSLKQPDNTKRFLEGTKQKIFSNHQTIPKGRSPMFPGLVLGRPSPYYLAQATTSTISFQQDLMNINTSLSTHTGDKIKYVACVVFHHCSTLRSDLTAEELWTYSLANADGALTAKDHVGQLKPILMGTSELASLDKKGFLAIANRDNDHLFAENYQKMFTLQDLSTRILGPTVKGLIMSLGMPVESANTLRDVSQNSVNNAEQSLSQLDIDTTRVITGDPLIQKQHLFENVKPDILLLSV